MRFLKQRVRTKSLITLSMLLAAMLSACVQAPSVYQTANTCSTLVPEDWYKPAAVGEPWGIESAPLPSDDSAGAWVSFGIAQTGQLDKSNGRTKDTVGIIQKCEARDRAAFEALQPKPWWKFWS